MHLFCGVGSLLVRHEHPFPGTGCLVWGFACGSGDTELRGFVTPIKHIFLPCFLTGIRVHGAEEAAQLSPCLGPCIDRPPAALHHAVPLHQHRLPALPALTEGQRGQLLAEPAASLRGLLGMGHGPPPAH